MKVLCDTHILIWLMEDDAQLGTEGRRLIASADEVLVSSASIWEMAIKISIGKMRIDLERLLGRMAQAGIGNLPVTNAHAKTVADLPLFHRDPFDRLLVAQAMEEKMYLLTADANLPAYSDLVVMA